MSNDIQITKNNFNTHDFNQIKHTNLAPTKKFHGQVVAIIDPTIHQNDKRQAKLSLDQQLTQLSDLQHCNLVMSNDRVQQIIETLYQRKVQIIE
ncbi:MULTISPECIES: T3SS regulon translocated regulator ExsE2 [Vibrio]|uniref:T3SS regulon translocated regulator ExsE2 n=1 Tax=Vibrio TaxID=662 RepID=UPI00056E9C67|nr:T3SS regulon translocated regulator ExsE2 [Vibrio pacinii]